jgi:hypothetical protein
MPELTPEPDTTGGENQKKKKNLYEMILGSISSLSIQR